jgi:hypothetical protein
LTTYYWPVVLPLIAIGLTAYAVASVAGARRGYRHGLAEIKQEHKMLQEYHGIAIAHADSREQELERCNRDKLLYAQAIVTLNETNTQLEAHNADLLEALTYAQTEIKALNMQTVEMPEIATVAPMVARPKRTTKTKTKE